MSKYSIVVPVYNVKEYLDDCIKSVLAQSISDYELILVNDESSDGSGEICDKYAAQYPNIHVIHQKNQGVAAARNTGIAKALGDYILFLDSDDWLEPNLLELLTPSVERACDVVEFGFRKIFPDGSVETTYPILLPDGISGKDSLQQTFEKSAMPLASCWCCAYRRQFLLDHALVFPLGVRYGEDLMFRMQVLENAVCVCRLQETLYCYRVRNTSVTQHLSLASLRDVLKATADICRTYPNAVTANYYCSYLLSVASLSRNDAKTLMPIYRKNRDLVKIATDKRAKIANLVFSTFGWYSGAKMIHYFIAVRHRLGNSR